jgi:hypothetical protein
MRKPSSNYLNKITGLIFKEIINSLQNIFKNIHHYPNCQNIVLYYNSSSNNKYSFKKTPKYNNKITHCAVNLSLPKNILFNTNLEIRIELKNKPMNRHCITIDGVYNNNKIILNVKFKDLQYMLKSDIKMIEIPLSTCIRHELEHVAQNQRKNPPKITYQSKDSWSKKIINIKKYLLSPNEIEAFVVGLAYKSRLLNRPLIEIIKEEVYNFMSGCRKDSNINKSKTRKEIVEAWAKYAIKRDFNI